jgi:alpha-mannosidase
VFDLTDKRGNYGVSILEDSKYGSDKPSDNVFVLRCCKVQILTTETITQNRMQDWGQHEVKLCLLRPRQLGGRYESWQARKRNQPLAALKHPLTKAKRAKYIPWHLNYNPGEVLAI